MSEIHRGLHADSQKSQGTCASNFIALLPKVNLITYEYLILNQLQTGKKSHNGCSVAIIKVRNMAYLSMTYNHAVSVL